MMAGPFSEDAKYSRKSSQEAPFCVLEQSASGNRAWTPMSCQDAVKCGHCYCWAENSPRWHEGEYEISWTLDDIQCTNKSPDSICLKIHDIEMIELQ